ncbi:mannose-6-phosphate isomerase, class I [Vibrio ponticus]|nr:mannose-6-phosphate isomerase, class I [Vibrio ponticus]
MNYFYPLECKIQNYDWGSPSSFKQLFDIPNDTQQPQAEIWMGAHANGCSSIKNDGSNILLSDFIEQNPLFTLGKKTVQRFSSLPYLFKVLSAEKALSVQVHPNKSQAENGFDQEQSLGITAIDDPKRNYKDNNHKPELVYALTPFQAMNGFRCHREVHSLLTELNIAEITPLVQQYEVQLNSDGLKQLFADILALSGNAKQRVIQHLTHYAQTHSDNQPFDLVTQLATQYPNDIGLFSPLFLHTITLNPGEAMFLNACTPHAYISGTALEIMANSDNVLRAGLTNKHIDVLELISCVRFEPQTQESLLLAPKVDHQGAHYRVPVDDFSFSIYGEQERQNNTSVSLHASSAEILLPLDAPIVLEHSSGERLVCDKGQAVFICAASNHYQVSCRGRFARAYCSLP